MPVPFAQIDPELQAAVSRITMADLTDIARARATASAAGTAVTAAEFCALDPGAVEVSRVRIGPASTGRDDLSARIYRPRRGPTPSGADVYAHGGGFCLGSVNTGDSRCWLYAQQSGVVVVNVECALAPEFPFPAGLIDLLDAVHWVHAQAGQLGVDPGCIGVAGHDAGAALASSVALFYRDHAGPRLRCQVLLFPATYDRWASASTTAEANLPLWTSRQWDVLWGHYLSGCGGSDRYHAVPARATTLAGLPRTLLITASNDALRDEGLHYGLRLASDGVATPTHHYPNTFHGFDVAAPAALVSQRALHAQTTFLRTTLRSARSTPNATAPYDG